MVKNHLKRIAMPTTWTTKEKKSLVWVANPNPGAHKLEEGMPLVIILREILNHANTAREAKYILNNKNILVDGRRRKDHRFNIGLMDVISIPELKENYRVSLSKHGKLNLIKIDDKDAKEKICRINSKILNRGKTQLGLSDGRSILTDKGAYKAGDSVVISIPEQKIIKHLAFEKDSSVLIFKGKSIGMIGKVNEIMKTHVNKDAIVVIKSGNNTLETLKKYCMIIGKEKPLLKIEDEKQ